MKNLLLATSLLGSVSLYAADPNYLYVTLLQVKPDKTAEYTDYHKKYDAFLDSNGLSEGQTQFVFLRRDYPIGAEHGYNRMNLSFQNGPRELDPKKWADTLTPFLKFAGWTAKEYQDRLNTIFNRDERRGRMYQEVAVLGSIEQGDWIRVNWVRTHRGKHGVARDANIKINKSAAQKNIDQGHEKGWMLYELPFPTSENDFDLLRIHVFKDSKSAQRMLPPLPVERWELQPLQEATAATRIEIYQVIRSQLRKQ